MKKTLVTGGTGFIGSHLYKKLLDFGRIERIKVFQDTMEWIFEDKELLASVYHSRENSEVFFENDYPVFTDEKLYETDITVSRDRSFQSAKKIALNNPKSRIAVLNFANAFVPGGGVVRGESAQEESLCRTSTLFPVIYSKEMLDLFYKHHFELNTFKASDSLIYSEGIIVCKTDVYMPQRLNKEEWIKVDVITAAAPDLSHGNMSEEELFECHYKRACHIFTVAASKKVEVLVLGAFGCGAFRNNPEVVAKAYKTAIRDFPKVFKIIEFAVYTPKDNTINFEVFLNRRL